MKIYVQGVLDRFNFKLYYLLAILDRLFLTLFVLSVYIELCIDCKMSLRDSMILQASFV